jgi:2,3-bisphosphoglycerate-dependent phosphoglycerate mutase
VATTLYLVRHGRTVLNEEERLQGWCDSPLTDEGVAGVRRTAEHLSERDLVAAYTSPFGRTVATARAILEHHPHLTLRHDDGLRELHFGEWEARPERELYATVDPYVLFGDVLRGTFPGLPGGESAATFLRRVRGSFDRIEKAHEGGVLVVSHGVTLMAYLTGVAEVPARPLPNGSVSVVHLHDDGSHELLAFGVDVAAHGVPEGPLPARADVAAGTAEGARTAR